MGRTSSKLPATPSFDARKSVRKSVETRKKNISINFSNRSHPATTAIPVSNDKPSFRLVENMILVWLDVNSEKQTDTNQRTLNHFRRLVNIVRTFTELEKCFHFLTLIAKEKIIFIVSGSFGSEILPRVDDLEQIYSIYIFCGNKSNHIEWTKPFKNIRGIHTQIKDLCDAIRYDNNQYDKGLTAISILPSTPITDFNSSNKQFISLQMMKSILLEIEYDEKFRRELIEYSQSIYVNNRFQLSLIDNFNETYPLHSPIWWYTRKCFLYRMLRKAFYDQDFHLISKLAFYIRDLHREIKRAYLQSHSHQYHAISVYRAGKISHAEFDQLQRDGDGLLSFNDFVITTLERSIALKFAQKLLNNPDVIAIIYKFDINPLKSTIPFVALNNLTNISGTNGEILLSMNTIFHINIVEQVSDRLYQVTLSPASKNDEQIVDLVNYMQEMTSGLSGWYKLSKIMMHIQEYDQVEHIYKYIKDHIPENQHAERAYLLHELGYLYDLKENLLNAISYYRQAIETYLQYLPADHPTLLSTYTNLADVLEKHGDFDRALEQYRQALKIEKANDLNTVIRYNRIALILQEQKKYLEAQQALEKAMTTLLHLSPSNPPMLADTYHHLAGIYYSTRDYTKALGFYMKALQIDNTTHPRNYSSLASVYFNLATTYEALNDSNQAINYAEKSSEAASLAFGNDHASVKDTMEYLEHLRK